MKQLYFAASLSLAFSLFSDASLAQGSSQGVFMVAKGQVTVSRGDSSAPTSAKVGMPVFVGDLVETGVDSRAKIVMNDRNVLNVSPQSRVKIAAYSSSGNGRGGELKLESGKVRTDLEQKYDGKANKFRVLTPTAVAGVRGTQFVTSFNQATQVTEVVTLRGEVTFQKIGAGGPEGASVVIRKGETSNVKPGLAPEQPKSLPKQQLDSIDKSTRGQEAAAGTGTGAGSGPRGGDVKPEVEEPGREGQQVGGPGRPRPVLLPGDKSNQRTLIEDTVRNNSGKPGTVNIQPVKSP